MNVEASCRIIIVRASSSNGKWSRVPLALMRSKWSCLPLHRTLPTVRSTLRVMRLPHPKVGNGGQRRQRMAAARCALHSEHGNAARRNFNSPVCSQTAAIPWIHTSLWRCALHRSIPCGLETKPSNQRLLTPLSCSRSKLLGSVCRQSSRNGHSSDC